MSKSTCLWKAMRKNLYSHYKRKKWRIGKWYKTKGELSMCSNGFHASERIVDSMFYVPMEVLAKVEVRGNSKKQPDKHCWKEMKIIRAWKWEKKDSVALSIYAATLVLANYEKIYPGDKRPRRAIQAAKKYLREPTKKNQFAAEAAGSAAGAAWSAEAAAESARSAAWSAAGSVAESAAGAAGSAAWSAEAAAESAAGAAEAAGSAAGAAWSAAWSAEAAAESGKILNRIEAWIRRRIKKLEEIKPQGGLNEI